MWKKISAHFSLLAGSYKQTGVRGMVVLSEVGH